MQVVHADQKRSRHDLCQMKSAFLFFPIWVSMLKPLCQWCTLILCLKLCDFPATNNAYDEME